MSNCIKLKPCPFCGNEEDIIVGNVTVMGLQEEWCDSFAVCCDCSKNGCGSTSGYFDTLQEAINAWNKRAEAVEKDSVVIQKRGYLKTSPFWRCVQIGHALQKGIKEGIELHDKKEKP